MFEMVKELRSALQTIVKALDPEVLEARSAVTLVQEFAAVENLAATGKALAAKRVAESGAWRSNGSLSAAQWMAAKTGTSVGKAKDTIATAEVLAESGDLDDALRHGNVSLDQATEIARAEESRPGAAAELLRVAQDEAFHVLKDKARRVKLEAEQHKGLAERQRAARGARSHCDDLGMVNIHLRVEPHVGTPIVNRAEAEAQRLHRAAKKKERAEPFERHLADAYAALLSGKGKGRSKRPELVVLVSHEVAKRGWKDVKAGEVCKIPGIGPVSPEVAKEIAQDAFLTGVFYDGVNLRNTRRWTRSISVEVRLALELGPPPDFDGVRCVDCGNRFRTENDHVEPHCTHGPAALDNLEPRCWSCHQAKTARDRKAGKLTPVDT
jgi:hypothetical protein